MSNNYFKDFVQTNGSLTPELEQEAKDLLKDINNLFADTPDLNNLVSNFPYFSIEDFNSIYNFLKGVSKNSPYVQSELRKNGIMGLSNSDIKIAKLAVSHLETFYGNDHNLNGVGYINSHNASVTEKIKKEIADSDANWLLTTI